MDPAEVARRAQRMFAMVCDYDIGVWAEHVFEQFDKLDSRDTDLPRLLRSTPPKMLAAPAVTAIGA